MLALSLHLTDELKWHVSTFLILKEEDLSLRYSAAKDSPGCQQQKQRWRNSFDHKGEKCGIKIQGQTLMFTREETRTWHSLGSWIREFKASGPTFNSTMHNFPLAGSSGMPEFFLIHLSGFFSLWPPASVLHNSACRTQAKGWRARLAVVTHAKKACYSEEHSMLVIWCFSTQSVMVKLCQRQNAKRMKC